MQRDKTMFSKCVSFLHFQIASSRPAVEEISKRFYMVRMEAGILFFFFAQDVKIELQRFAR